MEHWLGNLDLPVFRIATLYSRKIPLVWERDHTILFADRPDIALGRTSYRGLGVALEDEIPPAAVETVKGQRLDGVDDMLHGFHIQRDHVGITVHKADITPVLCDLHRVACQERAAAFCAL